MNIVKNEKLTRMLSTILAVVFGVLFVTVVANAVTTISTAIVTAGNITTSEGNIEATAGTLTVGGNTILATASSTGLVKVDSLKVDGVNGSTVSGIIFGSCVVAAIDVSAATTTYANCTGATGVTNTSRVFIQATSSLPDATVVTAASSTATSGTINVRFDAGAGATAISAATVSLNFWAVR